MTDLLSHPFTVARQRMVEGRLTPLELIERTLARIDEENPVLNAFVTVLGEQAWASAQAATQCMAEFDVLPPLFGLPFTVKDTIEVAGVRTTAGSKLLADYVPSDTAPAIRRIIEAGAILVGKTNCAEFGIGNLETWNPLVGQTRNPRNHSMSPGGSSGGDSAAVAAGMSAFGVGTDYGGSVRFPAHCTGIAGLRPTPGRISAAGVLPHRSTLRSIGPSSTTQRRLETIGFLTRSVADLGVLLSVADTDTDAHPAAIPRARRCAWFVDLGEPHVDPAVRDAVASAARVLADNNFDTTERLPPSFDQAPGLLAALRERDGLPEIERYSCDRLDRLGPIVRSALGRPTPTTRPELDEQVERIRQSVYAFLEQWPVLLMPVAASGAFPIEPPPGPNRTHLDLPTRAVTLLGLPAVTVPFGTAADGMPIGVQIATSPGNDEHALTTARVLERAFGPWRAAPTSTKDHS